MLIIPPTPAQIKKYGKKGNSLKTIPPIWENFVSLTTIRSGGDMKRFQAYEYQKIIVRLANQYSNLLVLKGRQLGVTQVIVSKFLHDACLNPAASSICFMRNSEDASAVSRRARQMLNSIPEYAQSDNDNVGYLKVKNGGDIYFKNSGKEGSRSLDSATGFLFDESAFVENIQQIYAASSPSGALSKGNNKKFIVSTPSSKSGWFWDRCNQDNGDINIEQLAIELSEGKKYKEIPGVFWFVDKAGWCKLILHYLAHPIYSKSDNYLEERLLEDGTDEETVQREYNLRFIDSAVAVFSSDLVRKNAVGEIENFYDEDGEYFIGLDTSTMGTDYTVISILKLKDNIYSLVNLYRKRQETSEYHIYQICEYIAKFKPKKVAIEVNGAGQIYAEQLSRKFTNVRFESVRTTGESKPAMVSNMVLCLEKSALIYPPNSPLVNEMLSFRRDGRKLEAAPGKHDDVVMSVAFALFVSPFNRKNTSIDFSKIKIREN